MSESGASTSTSTPILISAEDTASTAEPQPQAPCDIDSELDTESECESVEVMLCCHCRNDAPPQEEKKTYPEFDTGRLTYLEIEFYNRPSEVVMADLRQLSMGANRRINANHDRAAATVMTFLVRSNHAEALQYLTSGQDYWALPPSFVASLNPEYLQLAIVNHCNDVVEVLLQMNQNAFQPLFPCANGSDALCAAIKEGNEWALRRMLQDQNDLREFLLAPRYQGKSLALLAAKSNHPAVLRFVAESMTTQGDSFDFRSIKFKCDDAVQWAAYSGATRCLQMFHEWGQLGLNDPHGDNQRYLLEEAIHHPDTVVWLLERGARIDVPRVFQLMWDCPNSARFMAVAIHHNPDLNQQLLSTLTGDRFYPHCTLEHALGARDLNGLYHRYCEALSRNQVV